MRVDVLNFHKRILITQFLSIIFSIISNIHTRLLLKQDWMFYNVTIFYMQIILFVIIFSVIINRYLDGRWINVLLISIPCIVYWLIILAIGSKIFPIHTDSEDYGVGLILVLVSSYQWISVVIGSIVGTYIKKKNTFPQ